ncbi:hypothetical protein HYH03_001933 [Edaphochlamys debaryana]|uniref:Glycosyl transferase CAP10 domain-containing protein n=1 Tax=Edaphochlamys debaryana TaxID=47281 RepID=A0A835YME6_9CHLO|nr:hypothetical protein HYH03_001933 [Edaphochlamys debaryana]|eukprot:KAG2500359.1 hypothetical protein HYH03_001933 [Edaphochlamys debaryana]
MRRHAAGLTRAQALRLPLLAWALVSFLTPSALAARRRLLSDAPYDCSAHPWIDETLKHWFAPAYEAARLSTMTLNESLDTIAAIKWAHPTGKSMVYLTFNKTTNLYDLSVELLHRHNEPHKPEGMQKVIEKAVKQHNADLVRALKGRDIRFIFGTEDFPIVENHLKLRVPSFQMCANPMWYDVPVPDFTWEVYHQTRYANTSWWDLRQLLLTKGALLPWRHRKSDLFLRGDDGVGYRKTLMPIMREIQMNRSDIALFGVHANAHSTGYYTSSDTHFAWLDNWCHHRYLLHTSGLTYSASLKYKLACGSVVIAFENDYKEFYYPALKPGVHYLLYPEEEKVKFIKEVAPKIKEEVRRIQEENEEEPPSMARAAHHFALTQLTQEALSCYWYRAILAYSKLFFASTGAEVPAEVLLE